MISLHRGFISWFVFPASCSNNSVCGEDFLGNPLECCQNIEGGFCAAVSSLKNSRCEKVAELVQWDDKEKEDDEMHFSCHSVVFYSRDISMKFCLFSVLRKNLLFVQWRYYQDLSLSTIREPRRRAVNGLMSRPFICTGTSNEILWRKLARRCLVLEKYIYEVGCKNMTLPYSIPHKHKAELSCKEHHAYHIECISGLKYCFLDGI